MFAKINHLDDLLPHIQSKEEIKINYQPDHIVVCYMVSNEHTFDNPYALECRGITFDINGNIVGRPLHKFFNLGETARTQSDQLDFKKLVRVMEKIDGSMIHSAVINGKIDFKTKKSFQSDVAILAKQYMYEQKPNFIKFSEELAFNGYTPIFEFVHPMAKIVIDYKEPNFTLLHVRKNDTGEYLLNQDWLLDLMKKHNINTVHLEQDPIEKLLSERETKTDIEGYVLQFSNGDMVKVKTDWYHTLHHAITDLRERDIVELFFTDKLDDLKGFLADKQVDMSLISDIENRCLDHFNTFKFMIEEIANEGLKQNLTPKEMAMKHKEHEHFGLIMARFRSVDEEKMEANYKDSYLKKFLKDYSLNNVYTFGINEKSEFKKTLKP